MAKRKTAAAKGSGWRLAASLAQLRSQVNAAYPSRDKASDGTIGDASHAATMSDHNPNADGVVCAMDIDTDLLGAGAGAGYGPMQHVADSIRLSGDPRWKYLIFDGRIARNYPHPGVSIGDWAAYQGADPHTSHLHVSVGQGPDGQSTGNYDDAGPWSIDMTAVRGGRGVPPSGTIPSGQPDLAREWDVMATQDEIRQLVREECATVIAEVHKLVQPASLGGAAGTLADIVMAAVEPELRKMITDAGWLDLWRGNVLEPSLRKMITDAGWLGEWRTNLPGTA